MYIVIMGGGKVGNYLADVLLRQHHEVAVLEANRAQADRLSMELQGQYLIINGDGCDSDFQEDAGIRNADVFVAVTGRDDDNLVACEIATRVFNVPRCIARVNNPKNRRIFREVGIESVSSTMLIANMIEEEALLGSVGVVSALSRGDISLIEFGIPARMKHFDPEQGVPARRPPCPKARCSRPSTVANTTTRKSRRPIRCCIRAIRRWSSPNTMWSTTCALCSRICKFTASSSDILTLYR